MSSLDGVTNNAFGLSPRTRRFQLTMLGGAFVCYALAGVCVSGIFADFLGQKAVSTNISETSADWTSSLAWITDAHWKTAKADLSSIIAIEGVAGIASIESAVLPVETQRDQIQLATAAPERSWVRAKRQRRVKKVVQHEMAAPEVHAVAPVAITSELDRVPEPSTSAPLLSELSYAQQADPADLVAMRGLYRSLRSRWTVTTRNQINAVDQLDTQTTIALVPLVDRELLEAALELDMDDGPAQILASQVAEESPLVAPKENPVLDTAYSVMPPQSAPVKQVVRRAEKKLPVAAPVAAPAAAKITVRTSPALAALPALPTLKEASPVTTVIEYSSAQAMSQARVEVVQPRERSDLASLNTQPTQAAAQLTRSVAPVQVAPSEVIATPPISITIRQPEPPAAPMPPSQATNATHVRGYVEAFAWDAPVFGASSDAYTVEADRSWYVSNAKGYWSTLHWTNNRGVADRSTQMPLISNNTMLFLSRMLDTQLRAGTGIVFGQIADGWKVELSGRADHVLVVDSERRAVPLDSSVGERSFVFFNVEPGSHLVYVTRQDGTSASVATLPVVKQIATYVDLRELRKTDIRGTLLDASAREARGVRNIPIQVVGQPKAISVTRSGGEFSLREVWIAGDHPLYLQTEGKRRFAHRYRILPGAPGAVTEAALFHFDDRQIQSWASDVEGGLSAESGLVVGAVPSLVLQHGEKELMPMLGNLQHERNLEPETYTLSGSGHLQVKQPLSARSPRFIGVQVADGPVMGQIEDRAQRVIWAELIFASPRVINVVGPY